jgi:Skp family chaperone for outer membrane proteins
MRLMAAAVLSVLVLGAPALARQAPPPSVAPPPPPPQAPPPSVSAPPAPLRMAFVDLQRVAAESIEGKASTGKVQALSQKKAAELGDKQKALQANQQKLQQGAGVLSDAARAQAQREVDRLTVEIDRFQEDANAEVQELQQQLLGDFQEKLRPVIDGMIKELAIGLLFSAGDAGAVYIDPSLDITTEVIRRYDALKPGAAPAAGAKPAAPAAPGAPPPATAKPVPPATAKPAPPATPPPAAPPAKP